MLTVNQILEKKGRAVYAVKPDQTVYEALLLLAEKDIGAVLVLDGHTVCGIFSERDYARKIVLKGIFSREALVKDVMTKDLITVAPDANVFNCLSLMTQNHIRHLPVMQGEQVVGMISIGDVVNLVMYSQRESIESLESYIKGGSYA
jgi:CBS domain-containing protein